MGPTRPVVPTLEQLAGAELFRSCMSCTEIQVWKKNLKKKVKEKKFRVDGISVVFSSWILDDQNSTLEYK